MLQRYNKRVARMEPKFNINIKSSKHIFINEMVKWCVKNWIMGLTLPPKASSKSEDCPNHIKRPPIP